MTIHMYKKFDEKFSNGVDRRAYTVRNGRTGGITKSPAVTTGDNATGDKNAVY